MRILFLLDNTFTNDRRVHREAISLVKVGYELTLLAVKGNSLPEKEEIDGFKVERIFDEDIFDIKKGGCFNRYAQIISENYTFDIVHAHDQTMLHLGSKMKKNNPQLKLIYDSHELFHAWPLNISNYSNKIIFLKSFIVRKLFIRREHENRKQIDYVITVNQSLAKDLNDYLKTILFPIVIRNVPEKVKIINKKDILREKFNISSNKNILLFIGANIYRHTLNLEQVMDEFQGAKDVVLVFICTFNDNSKPVMDYVKKKGFENIYFHDRISPNQIPEYLSSADVGLVPTWNKKDLSYWYALDNKLFEYIQSEIPVLTTLQPEYRAVIDKYECGVCVNPDEKDSYIKGFIKIMNNYSYYKTNTKTAKQDLCWENEEQKLIELYKKLENE